MRIIITPVSLVDLISVGAAIVAAVFAVLTWILQVKPNIKIECEPFLLNMGVKSFPKENQIAYLVINNVGHIPVCLSDVKLRYGNMLYSKSLIREMTVVNSFEIKKIPIKIIDIISLIGDDRIKNNKILFELCFSTGKKMICKTSYTGKSIVNIPIVDAKKVI